MAKRTPKKTQPNALERLADTLAAIPGAEVTTPRIPVSAALEEAKALLTYVQQHADVLKSLTAIGMDPALLDTLTERAEALDEAQTSWLIASPRSRLNEAQDTLTTAYARRAEVLQIAAFHLRDDRRAVELLAIIRRGEGHADLIEDLRALARVIEDHLPAFKRDTTFDAPAVAQELMQLHANLASLLASEAADEAAQQAADLRNRAAMLLSQTMRELRDFGRFAFRADPARITYFYNHYERRTRRRRNAHARAAGASNTTPIQDDDDE